MTEAVRSGRSSHRRRQRARRVRSLYGDRCARGPRPPGDRQSSAQLRAVALRGRAGSAGGHRHRSPQPRLSVSRLLFTLAELARRPGCCRRSSISTAMPGTLLSATARPAAAIRSAAWDSARRHRARARASGAAARARRRADRHPRDDAARAPPEMSRYFGAGRRGGLVIMLESFSCKRGVPRGTDMVIDVQFLRNPHWDRRLRPLTARPRGPGLRRGGPRLRALLRAAGRPGGFPAAGVSGGRKRATSDWASAAPAAGTVRSC